jgi:hypothetical protein
MTGNAQSRWTGTDWEQLTPVLETRGDTFPVAGLENQVLARGPDADPFAVKWAESAIGMVWEEDFNNLQQWVCNHGLIFRLVSVTAIKTDGTVMIPDITYTNNLTCVLTFASAVSGTAVIRR